MAVSGSIIKAGNALRNSARNADPTYHFGPSFGPAGQIIKDDQTTPAQASSGSLVSTFGGSSLYHGYANVKSVAGTAHASLYATDTLGGLHLISGPVAVSNTAGYELLDFGLFLLDEAVHLDIRVYGPSGAYLQYVALISRPDDYDGADVKDPVAPAWVTTSGTTLINSGEPPPGPSPSTTYNPFILYPATAHEERVEFGAIYSESGDSVLDLYILYFSQPRLNGVTSLGFNFANGQAKSVDPDWKWTDSGLLEVPTTLVVSPGDDVALWAYGGYENEAFGFGFTHSILHVDRAFLAKTTETLTMTCYSDTNDASRTVGYSHPRPDAIASYEARIYYYNSGNFYLKEVVESNITDDPYVFPVQPPTGLADPKYLLMIRAYYYDGSWVQDGCFYTPSEALAVFRTRHKAYA